MVVRSVKMTRSKFWKRILMN